MKPAEIYRKHPVADDVYYIDGAWASACITAVDKRFTEAELAAEYHRACFDYQIARDYKWKRREMTYAELTAWDYRCETIHRIAALPHASDNGYE